MVIIPEKRNFCPNCGRKTQRYGRKIPITCDVCKQLICSKCSISGLCKTCNGVLNTDEQKLYERLQKSRNISQSLSAIGCILILIFGGISAILLIGSSDNVDPLFQHIFSGLAIMGLLAGFILCIISSLGKKKPQSFGNKSDIMLRNLKMAIINKRNIQGKKIILRTEGSKETIFLNNFKICQFCNTKNLPSNNFCLFCGKEFIFADK